MEDKNDKLRKKFLVYLEDNDNKIEGYFEVLKSNEFIVEFKTDSGNVIIIPRNRVLKEKGRMEE